jgi:hypothetical protein
MLQAYVCVLVIIFSISMLVDMFVVCFPIYGIPQSCCLCFLHNLVKLSHATNKYTSILSTSFHLLNIYHSCCPTSWDNIFFSNLCHSVAIGGLFVVRSCHITHSAATEPRAPCVLQPHGRVTRCALVLGCVLMTYYRILPMIYLNLK